MTYKYRTDVVETEYGSRKVVSTPTHRVYAGRWELSFDLGIYSESQSELEELGLGGEQFTFRMTGCPNGCARPYNSDVGLVGKARNKYTLFVGGRRLGDQLSFIHKDLVPTEEVVPSLVRLFTYFKHDRLEAETFGDFCTRKANDDHLAHVDSAS